jgi:hypothetical protein
MYNKPALERFGTFRQLTLQNLGNKSATGMDCSMGIGTDGQGVPGYNPNAAPGSSASNNTNCFAFVGTR